MLRIKNHGEGKKERIHVIEEGLHRVGLVKPGCVLREAVPCGQESEPRPRSAASPRDVRVVADEDGGKVHRDPHGSDLGDDVGIHPVVLDECPADFGVGAALLFVGGEPVQEAVVVRRGVPELLGASEHASVRGEHVPLLGVVDGARPAEAVAVQPRERAEGNELEERPGGRPVRVLPDEGPGVRGAAIPAIACSTCHGSRPLVTFDSATVASLAAETIAGRLSRSQRSSVEVASRTALALALMSSAFVCSETTEAADPTRNVSTTLNGSVPARMAAALILTLR